MKRYRHLRRSFRNLSLPFPRFLLVKTWAAFVLTFCAQAADLQPCAGITEPFLDVTLSAAVPGIIAARKFQEGDFVNEGAVLVELDNKLEKLEVERRKLVRDQKWSDFDGTQKLFKTTKGISKEEVEKKEAEYKIAAVEHDIAEEQLRRRQVISPLSGAITEIMLEVGEACQPYRRCYFITNIEARLAAGLKLGQTVKMEIDTGAGMVDLRGKIVFISPVVDPASGLRKIKVLFDNPEDKVQPGVSGRMLLE